MISPKQALFNFLSLPQLIRVLPSLFPVLGYSKAARSSQLFSRLTSTPVSVGPVWRPRRAPAVAGLAACETVRALSSLSAGNAAPDHAPSHSWADGDDSAVRSNRRGEGRQAGCRGRRRPLPIQPRSGHDAPPASSSAAWRHVSARACPPSTTSHGDRTGSWCDRWPPRMVAAACG